MASKIHRVRYYNPTPQIINSISYNKTSKNIAVARADASIEIWDLNYAPYMVKFIPGVEDGSVEALGWVNDRLLSTGLGGALVEWDLDKLNVKQTVLLTGYAAWCLDVNSSNTLVAVGTEQGYVNLYSVENDEIVYKKLFDKQEGRIMCCKFDKTGNILITGSIDTIRVWNVETGHATSRMLASRRGKETIVWCLAVLSDNIVVSGDSHGRLTFWDRKLGEQIESYTTHKADILCIEVSEDESSLYCSGVDPVITNFIKVNNNTSKHPTLQWVKNVQRNIHEHDVRVLALNDDRLVSVGADGYITLSSYPPKWVMRIPPMIPGPRSAVCAKKKLLLLRYSNHLEVWKLGSYATTNNGKVVFSNQSTKNVEQTDSNSQLEKDTPIAILNNAYNQNNKNKNLKLTDNPVKLVSVQTKGKKQIKCCELSPSGEFIVYSTENTVRMLKLDTDEDQQNTSLSKVLINGVSSSCDRIAFTEDSRTMALHCAGSILVLQVDPQAGATVVQTISTTKHLKASSILHLHISKKTSSGAIYLVAADTQGAIAVWTKAKKKYEHYVTLPKYKCVPSALTVDSKQESLVVVYVDQKIVEYELVSKKFAEWVNTALPPAWLSREAAASSVAPHPAREALVIADNTSLWVLERKQFQEPTEPASKKKSNSGQNVGLKIVPIKYLAGFHWVGDDEAVIVEVLPENIVSQLPPVISRK
ncbi:U3 small nucleolar RNA-associated protein 4 homolog [Ostrinia nubilalis]|uniref:U3 small nucleolar RNA-associated protein 4 homolog n=1 Tax=Ostrinia nubilalis TaxID=29057 RepID=UPI0030822595